MSDVEEIKRLLQALIDLGLEDDISNQLRKLMDIQLMTHREALEHHADLVVKAREGERTSHCGKRTIWINGDLSYVLAKWSHSVEQSLTMKASSDHMIYISKEELSTLSDPEEDADRIKELISVMYEEGDSRYSIRSSPVSVSISHIHDNRRLSLSYDAKGLHVSYGSGTTSDWNWKIRVVDDKMTISRPGVGDVVFGL
jgi:hypothetical protein